MSARAPSSITPRSRGAHASYPASAIGCRSSAKRLEALARTSRRPPDSVTLQPHARARLREQSVLVRAPRFIERSLTVAAVLTLLGVLLVGAGIGWGDAPGAVVGSLGGIVITVALLSVLYDAFLKDVLLGEIYSALAISDEIHGMDLREAARNDQIDLEGFLRDASRVTLLPLDPSGWLLRDWRTVLDHASDKVVQVTVLLPTHDSPHVDVLANRLRVARSTLEQDIGQLPDRLGRSWDEHGHGLRNSTLQVMLYGSVPAVGFVVTENGVLLEVPPSLGHPEGDRTALALRFGRDSASFLPGWIDGQLEEKRIPAFSRSVARPLPAAPTPDSGAREGTAE
jgi:hypothetical protein